MSAAAFARLVGVPEVTVRRWCRNKLVAAARKGPKVWRVDLEALKTGPAWQQALYRDVVASGVLGRPGKNRPGAFRGRNAEAARA